MSVLPRKRPAADVIDLLSDNDENENNNAQNNDNDTIVLQETCGLVAFPEFLKIRKAVEEDDGWETCQFEDTHAFKRANHKMTQDDTHSSCQRKAQYGRVSFLLTKVIFQQIAHLKYFHVFLDIGHGVGNTVLQAAYTIGCEESKGIELVGMRHERAEAYRDKLEEYNDLINRKRDGKNYAVGRIRMRHGSLQAPEHRNFLTQDTDVAFCNNFGDVFGQRSVSRPEEATMDMHLAALFCLLKPGACMITLGPLPLPPSLDEANMIRKRLDLEESDKASFYNVEEYELFGKQLLSWTSKSFVIYKYTRIGDAAFLCCNKNCEKARTMQTIPATKLDGDLLLNHCDCKMAERSTRNTATYKCPRFQIHVQEQDEQ